MNRLANSRMSLAIWRKEVGLGCTVIGKNTGSFNHSFIGVVSVLQVLQLSQMIYSECVHSYKCIEIMV